MSLLRFLGLGTKTVGRDVEPTSLVELESELETLEPKEARFVAAFAYLLARIAAADLETDDFERSEIARRLEEIAGMERAKAEILAVSAMRVEAAYSPSDDHLVARAFRDMSENSERLQLLRCLYAVAAADKTISTREDNEIFEVATAIGVAHAQVVALRSGFKQYLGSMKTLPTER